MIISKHLLEGHGVTLNEYSIGIELDNAGRLTKSRHGRVGDIRLLAMRS
jgi:hypothetical protein